MEQNFTQNQMVQQLYKELLADESAALKAAVRVDSKLQKESDDFLMAYHYLPKVKFNPSNSVLERILRHSATTQVEPQV
ncbi:MAG: hypothetical protein RIS64_3871 [Bacteroidota bacterium]|jgi:predicted phosphohydrolase